MGTLENPRFIGQALLAFGLVLPVLLFAQTSKGDLKLDVRDSSGAAVSASGVAINLDSGVRRGFKTDPQGAYTLLGLPYGRYQVQISKEGFATASVVIDVQSASSSQSIALSVGTQRFTADVVSMTPLPGDDRARSEIPLP